MSEWMDISTAPRDRFIWLYCMEDNSRWLAKWQEGSWYGVDDNGFSRQGASAGDPDVVTGWFVNCWQPLPPPPDHQTGPSSAQIDMVPTSQAEGAV